MTRETLLRTLHERLIDMTAQRLWAELSVAPGFAEAMERAELELAAGQGVRYRVWRGGLRRA